MMQPSPVRLCISSASLLILFLLLLSPCHGKECECGVEQLSPRIINGRIAQAGRLPWVVFILNRDLLMACSGTIVSEHDIITSAHCIAPKQNPNNLYVFIDQGCHKEHLFDGRQLKVHHAWRHPDFLYRTGGNDIALLHLQRPLHFNDTFMPICLSQDDLSQQTHDSMIVSGWGLVNEGLQLTDNDCLNEAELEPVPDYVCRLHYGTYLDTTRIMCAGGGSNICHGDSGGPLMVRRDGRVFLTGVTSFGRTDCGVATKQPAAFERVNAHFDWINKHALSARLCFK